MQRCRNQEAEHRQCVLLETAQEATEKVAEAVDVDRRDLVGQEHLGHEDHGFLLPQLDQNALTIVYERKAAEDECKGHDDDATVKVEAAHIEHARASSLTHIRLHNSVETAND